MATAETKKIPEVIIPGKTEYILTINQEEAQALVDLISRIGGHPIETRRGLISAISEALYTAGVKYQCSPYLAPMTFTIGDIKAIKAQGTDGLWFT